MLCQLSRTLQDLTAELNRFIQWAEQNGAPLETVPPDSFPLLTALVAWTLKERLNVASLEFSASSSGLDSEIFAPAHPSDVLSEEIEDDGDEEEEFDPPVLLLPDARPELPYRTGYCWACQSYVFQTTSGKILNEDGTKHGRNCGKGRVLTPRPARPAFPPRVKPTPQKPDASP